MFGESLSNRPRFSIEKHVEKNEKHLDEILDLGLF